MVKGLEIPGRFEPALEKLKGLVGETRFAQAVGQARLYEQTLRQLAAEDEDKAREIVYEDIERMLDDLPGPLRSRFRVFLRENAGAVSINWLIGIAVVIFIFAMLYPMIIDFTGQAAASTSDTSTQTMINMIPKILALVLVVSILLGAFYGQER